MLLYHTLICPKDAEGMANSVDPGQTAPDPCLHCLPRPVCPKTYHYVMIQIFNGCEELIESSIQRRKQKFYFLLGYVYSEKIRSAENLHLLSYRFANL